MDFGLFVLRVALGGLFFVHGAQKLFGWFSGYGLDGTGGFLESLGFRPGRTMAVLAGLTEVGAAFLLTLGFLTPLGAAGVIGVMIAAIASAKWSQGLIGGYELELFYAITAFAIAFTGPGVYSVDNTLGFSLHGYVWAFGALALAVFASLTVLMSRRAEEVEPAAALSGQHRAA